jgi:hypothetical protein
VYLFCDLFAGEFNAFQTKVMNKLNMIIQLLNDKSQQVSRRELFKCPDKITSEIQLPATSIEDLEKLDNLLGDKSLREDLVRI